MKIKLNWPEIRLLFWLSLPLVAGQLAQTGMGVVDTMMAGSVSTLDLAGVALGSAVWLPTFLFMSGVLLALTPSIAQSIGKQDAAGIKRSVMQGIWLAALLTLLTLAILGSSSWWMRFFSLEAAVYQIAVDYIHALAWGVLPALLFQVVRFFHEAHGLTKITMILSIIGFVLNIPLNALFVYGYGFIPAMGGVGCGFATSLVYVAMALVGWWLYWSHPRYRLYRQETKLWSLPQWLALSRLLRMGVPIGGAILFEVGLFTFIAFLVTPLGTDALAAHQVAISFTALIFMLPLSLAMALTIRVGQLTGAGDLVQVRLAIASALWISVALGAVVAVVTWLLAADIVALYTSDTQVALIAVSLFFMAALYQVSDAVQVACAGALRGIGDTTSVMWVTLVSYWGIGLPVGFYLCYGAWNTDSGVWLGITGFWLSFVIGLTVAALGLAWRVYTQFFRHSTAVIAR
ncbi:MAG: MATE family efflux transporter [Gammaproteobacteria bacterium]|nr:MATE family efflux transporter [Gammaproteobacteria bacterium]